MDRRSFIVTAAAASVAVDAMAKTAPHSDGQWVEVTGWLSPAEHGPGHYFLLSPTPSGRDPASSDVRHWTPGLIRAFPADTRTMRTGKVTLKGKLYQGKFTDIVTGHSAGAVLIDAVIA